MQIVSSYERQKVCSSKEKTHHKNKMYLHKSFAKYQVVNFLFYVIELDDVGLFFMFAFQGFSTWECSVE